jgi:uncharacterized membrane protein YhhN
MVAVLLFAGAAAGLFTTPRVSGVVYLVFVGLGLLAGILGNLGEVTAPIALFILLFGVELASATLWRVFPHLQFAWWQPPLIAVAALVAVRILAELIERRHARDP